MAEGREASRSRASDSPWEGECTDARTARPIEEYSAAEPPRQDGLRGGWIRIAMQMRHRSRDRDVSSRIDFDHSFHVLLRHRRVTD